MKYLEEVELAGPDFADLYDEVPLWSAPFGLLALERVPIRPGLTILDIGSGTGFLTVELAQRCGAEARVIAVDPWQAAMHRLRRKIDFLGLRNVELIECDAASIALADASVDVILSNLGVNNFDNPQAVLATCARVAKPEARLVLTTNLAGHMAEFYAVFRATLIELGHEDRLAALDAHISHRGTVGSVEAMLRQAGFEPIHTVTDSFRMRFADGSALLRHYFIRLAFLPAWKSIAPAGAVESVFHALERNLNATAKERGELALTIPMGYFEASKRAAGGGAPPPRPATEQP